MKLCRTSSSEHSKILKLFRTQKRKCKQDTRHNKTTPISSPIQHHPILYFKVFLAELQTALWSGRCLCTRPTEVPRPQGGQLYQSNPVLCIPHINCARMFIKSSIRKLKQIYMLSWFEFSVSEVVSVLKYCLSFEQR